MEKTAAVLNLFIAGYFARAASGYEGDPAMTLFHVAVAAVFLIGGIVGVRRVATPPADRPSPAVPARPRSG